MQEYIWLIPFFPLVGAAINLFLGKRLGKPLVSAIACSSVFVSFMLALWGFFTVLGLPEEERSITNILFNWVTIGDMEVNMAFLLDPLSAVMILVVSGVGLLIHIYSTGYMAHEARYSRYFAYLNLFTFNMLTLVLGNSLLLMFLGWEGVGLCSYLLIGFWFEKRENAVAGMKAFVVNRIGDFGFTIGVLLLFWSLASHGVMTLDYDELRESIGLLPTSTLTAVGILLFVGATGKSAQIPLYVWLPDAMAGPTPVSALIHAATMVTAGVYMIARMNFLYILAPDALSLVAWVGALTALVAATIGIAQNDIKKVLAYSTVSQLGYMFIGVGVGAFSAGIFHLVTHAFFKALLFLCSGSVIHGMSGEQDMRRMGGLRTKMPITFYTMLIGTLAIAGTPMLSGFFSKDEILWMAFASPHGHPLIWLMGATGAGITSFYMFRLIFMTFFGECRADHHTKEHIHESPYSMTIPLMLLALGAVLVGYLGVPKLLGGANEFEEFLKPVMGHELALKFHSEALEWILMGISVTIALVGFLVSYNLYMRRPEIPDLIIARVKRLHETVYNKYYIDEIYNAVFVENLLRLNDLLAKFDNRIVDGIVNGCGTVLRAVVFVEGKFDNIVVDGLVNLTASAVTSGGRSLHRIQTGRVQQYLLFGIGALTIFLVIKVFYY